MITLISFLLYALIFIFSIFGFLILIEYLKYFKRKIVLNLRYKLNSVTSDEGAAQ